MSYKLNARDAEFIRVFREAGFRTTALAREYDVHPDTVRNVVHGKSFRSGAPVLSSAPVRRRKLDDGEVRLIRKLTGEGYGEHAIWNRIGRTVGRSTVRQVMNGDTYKDIL